MNPYTSVINATEYPPHLKHKAIFTTFVNLNAGEAMLLVNDHDPVPLKSQLEGRYPRQFDWEYVEKGPATYQIKITKID